MRSVTADDFEERLVANSMLEFRYDVSAILPFQRSKNNCGQHLDHGATPSGFVGIERRRIYVRTCVNSDRRRFVVGGC
jgi:hypothetical protein